MARLIVILAALPFVASGALAPDPIRPDPEAPRPIPMRDTVFMEDMTWMEVRDAMRAGKDTAIVATGGIEQNERGIQTPTVSSRVPVSSQIANKSGSGFVRQS